MDIGLIVSFAGVVVAALAGILGVWMERDPGSPKTWGLVFSGFIVVASGVELSNTVSSEAESAQTDATLATVLEAMSDLASKGNNPALEQFVGSELAVQARANPQVVKKMEKSIVAKGGDPKAVTRKAAEGRRMSAGLPANKPAAGERPTLGGARTPGAARAGAAGRAGAAARTPGGAAGARAPGGLAGGPGGAAAGAAGAAVKAGKAGAAAASAVEGGAAATQAAARTAGAAAATARGAADQATQAAKEAEAAATKAKDTAKEAEKAADDAKKKGKDAANDALKGLGS